MYQLCSLFFIFFGSTIVSIFYCWRLLLIYKHSFWSIFLRWFHSKYKFLTEKFDLSRQNLLAIFLAAFELLFIWSVNKSDTVCLLIYCVHLGYILELNSDLSRHFVISIWLRCIHVISWLFLWINQTIFIANLRPEFVIHSGVEQIMEKLFDHTLCVRYVTNINSGILTIWPVITVYTMC